MEGDKEKDFLDSARVYFRTARPKNLERCAVAAALISIAEDTRRIADTMEATTKSIRKTDSKAINIERI